MIKVLRLELCTLSSWSSLLSRCCLRTHVVESRYISCVQYVSVEESVGGGSHFKNLRFARG